MTHAHGQSDANSHPPPDGNNADGVDPLGSVDTVTTSEEKCANGALAAAGLLAAKNSNSDFIVVSMPDSQQSNSLSEFDAIVENTPPPPNVKVYSWYEWQFWKNPIYFMMNAAAIAGGLYFIVVTYRNSIMSGLILTYVFTFNSWEKAIAQKWYPRTQTWIFARFNRK